MKNVTRWPPSYSEPFTPRMPALYPSRTKPSRSRPHPAAVPLSVMKTSIVSRSMSRSRNFARMRAKFSSMFVIMP